MSTQRPTGGGSQRPLLPGPTAGFVAVALAGIAVVAGLVFTTRRSGADSDGHSNGRVGQPVATTANSPPSSTAPAASSSAPPARRDVPLSSLDETGPTGVGSIEGPVLARIGGRTYARGIAVTCAGSDATTQNWYRWSVPSRVATFSTQVGLDDRVPTGPAQVQVTFADERFQPVRVVTVSVDRPSAVSFPVRGLAGLAVSCRHLGATSPATDFPAVLGAAVFLGTP